MKKVMFVLAVAGMISLCSCKSNKPVEETMGTETEVLTEEAAPVVEEAAPVAEEAAPVAEEVAPVAE